jgi:peptidoglycan/LPS O-acetylase OafA/YrhL
MQPSHHVKRHDLQGLRALAVAGVVAYHFEIAPFRGGFVGVDVFFVLSGYFITRMLLTEALETGGIDLLRFWGNRIKRLLPNGLLVIAVTALVALLVFPTYRSQGVLTDAVASALFAANFHFAFAAVDYFQLGAPRSPLLHFWSLAVEEQFYLITPGVLLVALLATSRRRPAQAFAMTLVTIAVGSFIASILEISSNQPAAFYLSPYRAWQLSIGGLVGLTAASSVGRPGSLLGIGAWIGISAIIASYASVSDAMVYPGYWALIPTFGTVLLLLGLGSPVASGLKRALSIRPFVTLGDMSYSVYLWHWPVVVFLAALWPDGGPFQVVFGLLLTALLSFVAYKLVESPLHKVPLIDFGIVRTYAAGASATALLISSVIVAGVVPGRTAQAVAEQIEQASKDLGPNYLNGCHREYDQIDQPPCLSGNLTGPRVLLFGDSHAAQWFTAVERAARAESWAVQIWTKTSCPAVEVTIWYGPKKAPYTSCDEWRSARMADLLANPPDLVIVASSSRYQRWVFDPATGGEATPDRMEQLWVQGAESLARTLTLSGIEAVQIVDTPEMNAGYQDCLSEQSWDQCGRERGAALAGLPLASTLPVLDLTPLLCEPVACKPTINDTIAYRDQFHITSSFASTLFAEFVDVLRDPPSRD